MQGRLGQIFADSKACNNPDCACCANWILTVSAMLTLFGSVVGALQVAISAKNGLLKEIADLRQRLILYDNPNTSPSKRPIPQRKQRAEADPDSPAKKRRPGAQPGHQKSAERLQIESEEHRLCTECPECHGRHLTEYGEGPLSSPTYQGLSGRRPCAATSTCAAATGAATRRSGQIASGRPGMQRARPAGRLQHPSRNLCHPGGRGRRARPGGAGRPAAACRAGAKGSRPQAAVRHIRPERDSRDPVQLHGPAAPQVERGRHGPDRA